MASGGPRPEGLRLLYGDCAMFKHYSGCKEDNIDGVRLIRRLFHSLGRYLSY